MSIALPSHHALAASGAILATSLGGAGATSLPPRAPTPVVTLVKVRAPRMAPAFLIRRRMRATVSQYAHIPGLSHKAYTISRDGYFGGAYLWTDHASAERWFDTTWHARVRRERGVDPDVQFMEAPVVLDNEPDHRPASRGGEATLVVSLLPIPAGVSRERLVEGFGAAVPIYRNVPGLLRKYFVITPDGRFGGVYLWATRGAAEQHYSNTWRQQAVARYGAVPMLEWFSAPILTPSADSSNHVPVSR